MTLNRDRIENAVASVLRTHGVDNVRVDVNTDKIDYPLVIVNMIDESKEAPRLPSDISVEVICQSIIGRDEAVGKTHYMFADKVRTILSARGSNGLYSMLWGAGLPVGEVGETVDLGTEIQEEEGGSMAISNIKLDFRLAR